MATPDHGTFFPDDLFREIRGRFHHVEADPYRGPRVFADEVARVTAGARRPGVGEG